VTHEELQESGPEEEEFDDELDGPDEWDEEILDEESLGLDWNEADEQTLVRDVVPGRWAD
jgi:hypothetical protein